MVNEGDNHVAEKQKSLTSVTVRHIRKLMRGYVEMFRQNLTVAACLVKHIDEVRVFKDVFNLARGQ